MPGMLFLDWQGEGNGPSVKLHVIPFLSTDHKKCLYMLSIFIC